MEQVTDLSPAKQALLAKWMHRGIDDDPGAIRQGAADAPPQLSFVQERQLFLELLDPHTSVNNLAVCVVLDGPLDLPALEKSANRVIARHETLRTSFDLSQGVAIQRISPELSIAFDVVDLQPRMGEAEGEALRCAELEAAQPFELGEPPLLRARVFRVSMTRHVLLIVIHHTISDGWSLGILLRELFSGYASILALRADPVPPLPIQYRDFATWQRDARHAPLFERQLEYWKGQLSGELPALDLPIDYSRPARQTFSGATHRILISPHLTAGLKELSRRNDATPFMTLLTVLSILLHRYSRQDDILVGTPDAGRSRPETHDLIGAFINTLVLRTRVSGNPGFAELLARVRRVALEAYANRDLPFERLVAELRPQRDLSRPPIFQVAFIFQNAPLPQLDIPGVSFNLLTVDRGAAQFDLTLIVNETGEGLEVGFEYNSDLFDRSSIERMARSFTLILEAAVSDSETRVSALPLMGEAERRYLMVELNDTRAHYPGTHCLHELIEAQVDRTPEAVALICGNDRLTYRELDRRADMLAAVLRARGVEDGVPVGVYLERSANLVTALLAILKAGGAYVPIDPAAPAARVSYVLRDAGASLLLAQASFPESGGIPTLPVGQWSIDRPAARRLQRKSSPAGLAYLIYTSGSTGEPKGVRIHHAALVNLLWSMRRLLDAGPGDSLLAVTSLSFDIAAVELYLPLIVGATVILADREMTLDPNRLQQAVAAHGVKIMQATPSMWRLMLQGEWQGAPDLVALSGGEPLTTDLAESLLRRVRSLWNLYGPTETTVWSAAGRIRRGQHPITIGRPIANTQLYVLDPHRQPVPIGVSGELYIGGDGVSLGYQNRPELTAEKFVSLPSGLPGSPGARLFKTGDLARYRADGEIEVLGRLDDQIKLHGFRIEPGEIESALQRHPLVREVVVVAQKSIQGDKRLVAYLVTADGERPAPSELREFLLVTVPAYMVPAVFVFLPRLPLSPAGKIDRGALPLPPSEAGGEYTAATTPMEHLLAGLFAQVLGLPQVGVHDNVFDLGAGSIQILELVARAHARGVTVAPQLFFEHQTVAQLALHLASGPELPSPRVPGNG